MIVTLWLSNLFEPFDIDITEVIEKLWLEMIIVWIYSFHCFFFLVYQGYLTVFLYGSENSDNQPCIHRITVKLQEYALCNSNYVNCKAFLELQGFFYTFRYVAFSELPLSNNTQYTFIYLFIPKMVSNVNNLFIITSNAK